MKSPLQTYLDAEKPTTPEQDRAIYRSSLERTEQRLKRGEIDKPTYDRITAELKKMIAAIPVLLLALLRR